jgi:hypothetical protein
LKVECACIISIGYTHLHAHSSFKKMMQGTCCIWFKEINFPAALSMTALVFPLTWSRHTLHYIEQSVGSDARPRQACGGAGEPGADKGAHPLKGCGRLLIPPARD